MCGGGGGWKHENVGVIGLPYYVVVILEYMFVKQKLCKTMLIFVFKPSCALMCEPTYMYILISVDILEPLCILISMNHHVH